MSRKWNRIKETECIQKDKQRETCGPRLQLSGRSAHKGTQITASMSLPMNGLTIPLSEGVLLEEKNQHLLYEKKINPTSIIGRTHGNEFSKMALVPIIFECKRYETLSLYYVCYTDCVFSLDTPLKNFHIGVYIYLTSILFF